MVLHEVTKSKRGIHVVLLGIITNALLAVVKISAGVLGNSYALIADGIESTTDIFSSVIVWSGLKIAAKPPDRNHPYGHGKAEALSAMIVSLLLLAAAAVIVINSIHEIVLPHHAPAPYTLLVLVLVIITKEILFRTVFKVGSAIESTALRTDAWHHRSDALTSAAAFIGISVSLIMGPGYESADDYGAIAASVLIVINGVRLLKNSLSDIMDEAPSSDFKVRIIDIVEAIQGVKSVDNIKIRKSGLYYLVDLSIQVSGDLSVFEGHELSELVNDKLVNSDLSIQEVMVHTEPFIDMKGIH
jgi:cation diffusion facilitator family transporter